MDMGQVHTKIILAIYPKMCKYLFSTSQQTTLNTVENSPAVRWWWMMNNDWRTGHSSIGEISRSKLTITVVRVRMKNSESIMEESSVGENAALAGYTTPR
jgi:hypothetical protein